MLDLENIHFRNFKVSKAKDPDYIYVAARLTGNVDATRTIDTYVYLDIWNADKPSIETLQLRVIDAVSKAFSLSPEQIKRATPAVAKGATTARAKKGRAARAQ